MPEVTKYEPGTPSWVDVAGADVDALMSFYSTLFGWNAEPAGDPVETGGYRMFTLGGKHVAGAGPLMGEGQPPSWTTYVTVADADATSVLVQKAGGSVLTEPMDVLTAGRMAVLSDASGGVFAIWQPRDHIGAELVNEPVSLSWNELRTRDLDASAAFYGEVFGWKTESFPEMDGYAVWMLGEVGVGGMIDMNTIDMPAEVPAHWDVVFAVADTDAIVERAPTLGGQVVVPPMDIPVGRTASLLDPGGAAFSVIKLSDPPSQ